MRVLLTALVAAVVLGVVPVAEAQKKAKKGDGVSELEGRIGVGAHIAALAPGGASVRYFVNDSLGLELLVLVQLNDLTGSALASFVAGLRAEQVFQVTGQGFLSGFGGVQVFNFPGVVIPGLTSNDVVLQVEGGLKGEYMLWPDGSFYVETGLAIRLDPGDALDIVLGVGTLPYAAAGFTLWFR